MKDIIDGKLYDTESAEQIASWKNTGDTGDLRYVKEALYKTESGAYFVYGTGGAMSKYSKSVGSSETAGSSEIKPFDEEKSYQWCEDNGIAADIILDEFEEYVEQA